MKVDVKKLLTYKIIIVIAIVVIGIFINVSVFFEAMPYDQLPSNLVGALLGALIGALITLILLRGQTQAEEERGKNIRILEIKTKVFKDYIKDVWAVWEKQEITIEEFQNLTSYYYKNLMIYLNDERLKKIGNNLSAMGRTIGKDNQESVNDLRSNIISIINELSEELELGGQINEEIMEEHDKIVFPHWFKNEILTSLNEEFSKDGIFKEGKYETYDWGGYPFESICFDFKEYEDCKIVLCGFDRKDKDLLLHVGLKYQDEVLNGCRDTQKSSHKEKIKETPLTGVSLAWPIQKGEDVSDDDNTEAPELKFFPLQYPKKKDNMESAKNGMEIYRTKKRGFAKIFAKRVKFLFELKTIPIKGKEEELTIMKFMEKYVKK